MSNEVAMSAKAVIVERGRVLLVAKRKGKGRTYSLPGGHVEAGESLEEALRRECREELGSDVAVGELVGLLDEADGRASKVQAVFRCRLEAPEELGFGPSPDRRQEDVHWQALDDLADLRPEELADLVRRGGDEPAYRKARN